MRKLQYRMTLVFIFFVQLLLGQTTVSDSTNFTRLQLDGTTYQQPFSNTVFSQNSVPSYLLDQNKSIGIDTEKKVENGRIKLIPKFQNIVLEDSLSVTYETYLKALTKEMYKSMLETKRLAYLRDDTRTETEGMISEIVIKLPKSAMPKPIRKFLGGTQSRLRVNGNQKISFSVNRRKSIIGGKSEWSGPINFKPKQELNLNVNGKVGDKIHVELTHRSGEDTFGDPDKIKIRYEGYEDEIIQTIDSGNISLSLSGSEFIRYSVSSEGLFGIKSELKIGNLDVTLIIGKEEAKKSSSSFNGQSESQTRTINAERYIKNKYFYTIDPANLFLLYSDGETDDNQITNINNRIVMENGKFVLNSQYAQTIPEQTSLQVYTSISNYTNDDVLPIENAVLVDEAGNVVDESQEMYLMEYGGDYTYDPELGIIEFYRTITSGYIGIAYDQVDGVTVGNSDINNLELKLIYDNNGYDDNNTFKYQVRNYYNIGAQNIQEEDLVFEIYYKDSDGTALGDVNLAEDYGFDIENPSATLDLTKGIIRFPFIKPFLGHDVYGVLYEQQSVSISNSDLVINVEGKLGLTNPIKLNQMGILPGSVRVILNGETLVENQDYTMDYDFGEVTITTPKLYAGEPELEITYQYLPFATTESKTLMGIRADWNIADNAILGGTFIYHSEVVRDEHPKIGEENKTVILADIDGEVTFNPNFMTRMVDMLPFIRTDEESELKISGETAMSIPKIYGNDKSEAYIDDMEASLDIFSLNGGYGSWFPASKPLPMLNNRLPQGKIYWFNNDELFDQQNIFNNLDDNEKEESASVLAIRLNPSDIAGPGGNNHFWGGVMKAVGDVDVTEKKYIEVVLKEDWKNPDNTDIVMHLDLGDISEDFYWGQFGEGYNVLNDEDKPETNDNKLDYNEDTGFDKIAEGDAGDTTLDDYDAEEQTYTTSTGEQVKEYRKINNFENNNRFDSEDLNNDGNLNTVNNYRSYTISLNHSEVYSYSGTSTNGLDNGNWKIYRIPLDQFYTDHSAGSSSPSMNNIRFARMWFEANHDARIFISSVDLVGNKWIPNAIRDYETDSISLLPEEKVSVGIVNTQKNSDFTPPPNTETSTAGSDSKFDQAIVLDYRDLQQGNTGFATQEYDSKNKLNLLSYGKIRYWAFLQSDDATVLEENVPMDFLIRIGADSLTYYEVRYPLPIYDKADGMIQRRWEEIELDFQQLTKLKQLDVDTLQVNSSIEGRPIIISRKRESGKRYATLSSIEMMQVGLVHAGDESLIFSPFNGTLFVDDIRVADPYEDIGYAMRTTVNANFADFVTSSAEVSWQSDNFQTNQDKVQTDRMKDTRDLLVSSKVNMHHFIPSEYGFSFPVTYRYTKNKTEPRFKYSSDVLVEDLLGDEKKREITENEKHNITVLYSQSKIPDYEANWLQYTLKPLMAITSKRLSGNAAWIFENKQTSTVRDTTASFNTKITYSAAVPENLKKWISVNLFKDYKFYYFPNEFSTSVDYSESKKIQYKFKDTDDDLHWELNEDQKDSRALDWSLETKYKMLNDLSFTYNFDVDRELILDEDEQHDEFWGQKIGVEKSRSQKINGNYTPSFLSDIYTFSARYTVNYTESRRKKTSSTTDTLDVKNYLLNGSANRTIDADFTLKNKDMLSGLKAWTEEKLKTKEKPKEDASVDSRIAKLREQLKEESLSKENREKIELALEKIERGAALMGNQDKPVEEPEITTSEEVEKTRSNQNQETIEKPKEKMEEEEKKIVFSPAKLPLYAIKLLTNFDNISFNYSNNYNTAFNDREDRPSFFYQIGVPHAIEDSIPEYEILSKKINSHSFNTATGLRLTEKISLSTSPGLAIGYTYGSSGTGTKTVEKKYPGVSVSISDPLSILPFTSVLKSSSANVSVKHNETESNSITLKAEEIDPKTSLKTVDSFNSTLTIRWGGNVSTSFSQSYSESYDDKTTTDSRAKNYGYDGSIDWTFSAEGGMTIPLLSKIPKLGDYLKRKIKFKNDLTASLSGSFNKNLSESQNADGNWTVSSSSRQEISIQPSLRYEFSRNITGQLSGKYNNKTTLKDGLDTGIFELDMSINIVF